ncbi:hypothetical protein DMENIID0001_129290 [Sergentomyia squamirostris]
MLPKKENQSSPSDFVYLDNPVKDFQPNYGTSSIQLMPSIPRLRDVTNRQRMFNYDHDAAARIAQEENLMRQRQEKKRQKALLAMQIAEDRRRRMLRQQDVENIELNFGEMNIDIRPRNVKQKIFKDPSQGMELLKEMSTKTLGKAQFIRYTIEELKNLRPKIN